MYENPLTTALSQGFGGLRGLPVVSIEPDDLQPRAVTAAGRRWLVCAEPVRWFERVAWWKDGWVPREVPLAETRVLRLQVQMGGRRSQVLTFDLAHDRTGAWRLVSVDGEPVTSSR